ncbi:MAG TPA: DNA gyrase subunit A [Chloroflexi bacterium]|nr:DNA gyrase subunit A [Chloroflexota bacterium]
MEVGTVRQVDIDQEMRAAYLDYAMSVIVSRALPDARDGLKPVHRRILYAMYDMGLRPDSPYRKSARIVGEVLGKYHPHGDAAVYEAMVRMAQDFAMRYPLVDGQGNFGSIDGDAAAAMRYTEARMQAIGIELLRDIEKDTVDFVENFDGSLQEPTVLPASIPNLLVNGSSGIAVGMSTSIPPHNMGEVCDALIYMLDHWTKLESVGLPELMQFIKGPDFPTGGLIFRYSADGETDNLAQAYATGRGKLVVQAKAHVEQLSRNRNRIIITELPYQVNKTSLIERIAELAREERVEGLTGLRDESDRQGLRIVIDLTRTVDPHEVLEQLYKLTPMRSTFSVIMLALVDGEPRLLTLKQALRVYLEHRFEVVQRRSQYDLVRARERAHILEGYLIALDNLDEVVDTIRRSRTVESAHKNLRRQFKLSNAQAEAILNMPLRRLAALERRKIEDEYKEKKKLIRFLEKLLKSPKMMRAKIKEELAEIKQRYADERRTLIIEGTAGTSVRISELLPDEKVWVVLTRNGLLSRTFDDQQPKVTTTVKDPPRLMISSGASETLYLFTADGMAATIPVHQLAQVRDFRQGVHFTSLLPLDEEQEIVAALTRRPGEQEGYLFLASVGGMVKRIALEDLPGLSAHSFQVMGLSGDALGWAAWTTGEDEIILTSAEGMAIRFKEEDVRPMGLRAAGVKGIKLGGRTDEVVGMSVVEPRASLWVITTTGFAKSSPLADYPTQGRYGQGVITIKFVDKRAMLAGSAVGTMDDTLIVVTSKGKPKYMRFGLAPRAGRNTKGEPVIALGSNEYVEWVVVPRAVGLPTRKESE